MISFLLFFYIPIFFILHVFTRHFLHRIQNLPPSPLCLPIIGHLHLLRRPLHRTLSRISDRYGPVFLLQLGSRPSVVVSSPAAAEECFAKNDIVFANRPDLMMGRIMGYNFTSLAWASYGDHWRNLRRIASLELLSTHRLQTLAAIRRDEVKLLIRRLIKINHERSADDDDRIVNLREGFVELTQNSMMRMIAGKRYYGDNAADLEEAARFRDIQTETIRVSSRSNLGDSLPFLRWVKWVENDMKEVQRKRDEFMQYLAEERKRKMVTENGCRLPSLNEGRKTLIEVLLSLQQTEPEYYTDEIIRGLMLVTLVAGTETSLTAMEWAFSLVLNHPEVLKTAQDEIDRHVGNDRLVDESDLPQLHYLQNIITETLRIYPPVPTLLPHQSSKDCKVGGFRIPRGTTLLVNAWGIQNDPTVWVDPTKFRPERFDGVGGPKDGLKWIPFGSGRRGCPGEGLAMRIIGLVLGSLIQCFEWERPNKELIDMTEGAGITISKAEPLKAKCRPRPTMLKLLSDQIGSI